MEMRRMVRQRLLAAEAAAAVIISLLVLSMDLANNGGSLSASTAPEVFFAKNSSLGSELHARDPGTAHDAVQSSTSNLSSLTDLHQLLTNDDYIGYQPEGFLCSLLMKKGIKEDRHSPYNNQTEHSKSLSRGPKDDGGSATVDENPYFRSDDHGKTYDMVADIPYSTPGLGFVFPDKTSELVYDVFVDAILDIGEEGGYEEPPHIVELDTIQFESSMEMEEEDCEDSLVEVKKTVFCDRLYFKDTTVQSTEAAAPDNNDSKPLIQWIFLKPLTKELWLATVCFVFFTGFVLWMIERSINPVFQGSSLAQFSTALYFVFSTLTFSHGQILRSPLSKIVLVVWCFAVLVLVQSYLATLSSMLAAEASITNGSSASAAVPVPLTLRSFSGLFVVTGCILAFMLIISFTRWVYATYTSRVRGSESQSADVDGGSVRREEFSTLQNDAANGSVVHEQPVQEVVRDNDDYSLGAHVSSAISRDEEAGAMQDSMFNAASEPAPDVNVQIEMTSTSNGVGGGAL